MKALFFLLTIGLSLVASVLASEIKGDLPTNLEIVSQDSLYVSILDKETGLIYQRIYKPEPWLAVNAEKPDWDIPLPPTTANFDTCFSFVKKWRLPINTGHFQFGDCDRDGVTDLCVPGFTGAYIYERPEDDTIFQLQAVIADHYLVMDYGGDADSDSKLEAMFIDWHSTSVSSMTLVEAQDSMSFSFDSVYAWPLSLGAPRYMPGGFTDIDGDGITEISFRPNYGVIYALENTGDNSYELNYTIPSPESLLDNYYGYIWGDFDSDGRNEIVTVGSAGRVICFENVASDSFVFVWRDLLPEWNTNWIIGPADLDSDGILEFYCMCASTHVNGYFVYGFEADGDNSFYRFWSDSLPGSVLDGGNLALQDFDGDGKQELMVCSNYYLGVYGQVIDGTLDLIYLRRGVYGTPDAYDTDQDSHGEIFIEKPIPAGHDIYEFTYGETYKGDLNSDCILNGLDVTYMINYFKGRESYPLPSDIYKADINGNCKINGADVLYLVNYLKGGSVPIDRECL